MVRSLQAACEEHDGITLKLNWSMLENRKPDDCLDLLWLEDGELLGFLGLYIFQEKEAEIGGMVHPAARRRGIWKAMLEQAKQEAKRRGAGRLLLVCAHQQDSAKEAALQAGAEYAFSEHGMTLTERPPEAGKGGSECEGEHEGRSGNECEGTNDHMRKSGNECEGEHEGRSGNECEGEDDRVRKSGNECEGEDDRESKSGNECEGEVSAFGQSSGRAVDILLDRAGQGEKELLTALYRDGFSMGEKDARDLTELILSGNPEEERLYTAITSDGLILGMIGLNVRDQNVYLFSFSVLPEHRGQGYGRRILMEAIRLAESTGHRHIQLEVETKNPRALSLYESCGFRPTYTNDYYALPL